jgi:hypothetical protein
METTSTRTPRRSAVRVWLALIGYGFAINHEKLAQTRLAGFWLDGRSLDEILAHLTRAPNCGRAHDGRRPRAQGGQKGIHASQCAP